MAAVCDICAKKPGFGNNRPWSKKATRRRFDPNIQRVRATVNGTPKRLNVCTVVPQGRQGHPLTQPQPGLPHDPGARIPGSLSCPGTAAMH